MNLQAVDVMGFAGGFTLGTVQAGFQLVGKKELPGGFGVKNCEANRQLLGHAWQADVAEYDAWEPQSVHYVFGNPPCSGFSLMSAGHFRGVNSPANKCMWAFAHYVCRVRPYVAVFESVGQAFTTGRELMNALHQWVREQTGLDYHLWHVKHNNLAVGGCAQRKRYFWVISRIPFGVEHPELRYEPTLWNAIGDLEHCDITWEHQPRRVDPHPWAARNSRTMTIDGHMVRFTPEYHRAMELLPTAGPWKQHEHIAVVAERYYKLTGTLPPSWEYRREKLINNGFHMGFHQLTRWRAHHPARVITGGALMLVLHPTLDRTLTHRETARIMGFPDDWKILPLKKNTNLQATWGKGIPVDSGRWISTWVRNSLLGSPGEVTGTVAGDRERIIDVSKPIIAKS